MATSVWSSVQKYSVLPTTVGALRAGEEMGLRHRIAPVCAFSAMTSARPVAA